MFEAVVFDMDGVITDTEKLYRKFEMEEGLKRGVPEDVMIRACEGIAGGNKYSNKATFESIVGRGIEYFEYRENMIRRFDAYVKENGVELKTGVKETLEFLKNKGIKIGLATSTIKERAVEYLMNHGIDQYFDQLIFGDMVSNGKPAPDIFLIAAQKLNLHPKDCVVIEDAISGINAAKSAGIGKIIAIASLEPVECYEKIAGSDSIIKDFTEFDKNILANSAKV